MSVTISILFILVLAIIIGAVVSKRLTEFLYGVVGIGAVFSLYAGINAMSQRSDIAGAILIATGLICLLGIAIAIKAFQPRP